MDEEMVSFESIEEFYKRLFFKEENIFEYKELLKSYIVWLAIFFNKDAECYMDCEFLSLIINGFNYLYKSFFCDKDIDLELATFLFCEHYLKIIEKNEKAEKPTEVTSNDNDAVAMYTLKVLLLFKDMDMADDCSDLIEKLIFNAHVIDENEKGSGKGGLENRKYHN